MEFLNEFKNQLAIIFTDPRFQGFFAGILIAVIVFIIDKWFIRGNT